jgi:signal transduction histidine kinase
VGPTSVDNPPLDPALLELMLDEIGEGIVFVGERQNIVYINRAGREMLRCSRQGDEPPTFAELVKICGFNPLEVVVKDPFRPTTVDTRGEGEFPHDVLGLRKLPRSVWEREVSIFGVPYLLRGKVLESAHNNATAGLLCFTDVRRIYEKEQAISESLSYACHELRTPLTALKNALDLLSGPRLGKLSEKQIHVLDLASRNAERLYKVVNTLVDLSRVETRSLQLAEVDMADILKRGLSVLEDLAQEKKVEIQPQLHGRYPRIVADAARLDQVIHNLVQNAIKFTPEGGRIEVSLEVLSSSILSERFPGNANIIFPEHLAKESLLLSVSDTGAGIPASHLESVFSKFTQAPVSAEDATNRGRGLGLNVVKTLVEAHGGTVWAESEPDRGSRFRVLLPILTREGHFIHQTGIALERVKSRGTALTLAILKITPTLPKPGTQSEVHQETLGLLDWVFAAVKTTVRPRSDQVEILDSAQGKIAVMAETDGENFTALQQRMTATLKQQAQKEGRFLDLRLIWGVSSYPENVTTAEEMVSVAVQATEAPEAEEILLAGSPDH